MWLSTGWSCWDEPSPVAYPPLDMDETIYIPELKLMKRVCVQ
jgi:hypothetical protein